MKEQPILSLQISNNAEISFDTVMAETQVAHTSKLGPSHPRKRLKMSDACSQASSGVFSTSVRIETKRLCGNKCWVCCASTVDVAHIIAQEDNCVGYPVLLSLLGHGLTLWQIELLQERGLLNFNLKSVHNAIALCPLCHRAFDNALDPGFFFVPSHLGFFIDYEKNDYARRAATGFQEGRKFPTSDEYTDYQISQGIITAGSAGLYRCIFLRLDFISQLVPPPPLTELNQTHPLKSWHGAPAASLRRGFAALGSLRINIVPPEIVANLRELQSLYCRNPGQIVSRELLPSPHSPPSEDLDTHPPPTTQPALPPWSSQRKINSKPAENSSQDHWVLGPDLTSSDAMVKYGHMFEVA